MCRLGFISIPKPIDLTRFTMLGTTWYSHMNSCGTGYATPNGKRLMCRKKGASAVSFWLADKQVIKKKALIFHVRKATNGSVTNENAHPFINEKGTVALCHNGVLNGYETTKEFLIKRGHVFTSETDSEVLLHAFEEWGNKFIDQLKKRGMTGSATILIIKRSGEIIAYTNNGSLNLYKAFGSLFGFSDETCLTGKEVEIAENTLYFIKDGQITKEQSVAVISEWGNYHQNDWEDGDYYWQKNHNGNYKRKKKKKNKRHLNDYSGGYGNLTRAEQQVFMQEGYP